MKSITVIIVNWNCEAVLSKCLDNLLNQTIPADRILIMDNGSNDNSLKTLTHNSLIDIRLLGANLGFAAANNRALSLCKTDYIALLNPDAFPNLDWIERMLAAAETNLDVAAFASLQLCDHNPSFVDGAGDSYHISGRVWRNSHGVEVCEADFNNKSIFSPCAAAALYRRQAVIEIGGFDEDFFCYVEDVDLGFRLQLAGYQSMLVGDAVVQHVGSAATGGHRSDFCVYYGHRNLVWAFVKNMPGILFWLLLPLHVLLNVTTLAYFSFLGQGKVIWRSKIDAIKGIPRMWQKRKIIQKKRVASIADIWKVLDKRYFWF